MLPPWRWNVLCESIYCTDVDRRWTWLDTFDVRSMKSSSSWPGWKTVQRKWHRRRSARLNFTCILLLTAVTVSLIYISCGCLTRPHYDYSCCPSEAVRVCFSVCTVRTPNSKTKRHSRKPKLMCLFTWTGVNGVSIFSSKWIQVTGSQKAQENKYCNTCLAWTWPVLWQCNSGLRRFLKNVSVWNFSLSLIAFSRHGWF